MNREDSVSHLVRLVHLSTSMHVDVVRAVARRDSGCKGKLNA